MILVAGTIQIYTHQRPNEKAKVIGSLEEVERGLSAGYHCGLDTSKCVHLLLVPGRLKLLITNGC